MEVTGTHLCVVEEKLFQEKTYKFHVFTQRDSELMNDQNFLCQASSMELLINNGFDFNKLIKDETPYLSIKEQLSFKQARKNVCLPKQGVDAEKISIPCNLQPYLDSILAKMFAFLQSNETCFTLLQPIRTPHPPAKLAERIEAHLKTCVTDQKYLVVTRLKTEANDKMFLQQRTGFTELIEYISQSRKPIVGCFLRT